MTLGLTLSNVPFLSSNPHQPQSLGRNDESIPHREFDFYSPMTDSVNRLGLSVLKYIENNLGSYRNTSWASRYVHIPRSNLEVVVFESDMKHLRNKHGLDAKFHQHGYVDQSSLTPIFSLIESEIDIPRSETGKTLRVGNGGFDTCTHPDVHATHKSNPFIEKLLTIVQELPKGASVLEIGGGYGGLSRGILALRPDMKFTSISADPNPVFRGIARLSESQRGTIKVISETVPEYDISTLDEKFDLVIQNRFTHFLNSSDLNTLIQQVASSLKDGGKLAVAQLASTNGSYRDILAGRESIPASEALPKQAYALKAELYPRDQEQLNDVVTSNGLKVGLSSGYGAKQYDEAKRDNQFDNIFVIASK